MRKETQEEYSFEKWTRTWSMREENERGGKDTWLMEIWQQPVFYSRAPEKWGRTIKMHRKVGVHHKHKLFKYFLLYVNECFACMCVCIPYVCSQSQERPEKDIRSLVTGVINGCETQCGCWELNLGILVKQIVFLTTEVSLEP